MNQLSVGNAPKWPLSSGRHSMLNIQGSEKACCKEAQSSSSPFPGSPFFLYPLLTLGATSQASLCDLV
jgi:hypothetical protein